MSRKKIKRKVAKKVSMTSAQAEQRVREMDDSSVLEWVDAARQIHQGAKTNEHASIGRIFITHRAFEETIRHAATAADYEEAMGHFSDARYLAQTMLEHVSTLGSVIKLGWGASEATRKRSIPGHIGAQFPDARPGEYAQEWEMLVQARAAVAEAERRGLIKLVREDRPQAQGGEPETPEQPPEEAAPKHNIPLKRVGDIIGPEPAVEEEPDGDEEEGPEEPGEPAAGPGTEGT